MDGTDLNKKNYGNALMSKLQHVEHTVFDETSMTHKVLKTAIVYLRDLG